MAPEIRAPNEGASHNFKVDIWALGILLYELLEEKYPFDSEDQDEEEAIVQANKKKGKKETTIQMKKEIDFSKLEFSERTPREAKALIKSLLTMIPENRINLENVLNHIWIINAKQGNMSPLLGGDQVNRYDTNACCGTGNFGNQKDLKIISWNINGLKSAIHAGALKECITRYEPDIICLQEIKIDLATLNSDPELMFNQEHSLKEYSIFVNCSKAFQKGHHHGVIVLTKKKPIELGLGMGIEKHDLEGRMITLEYQKFIIVAVYAPNPGNEDMDKMRYRTQEWDPAFIDYIGRLKEKKKKKNIIIIGDLNVSPNRELDCFSDKCTNTEQERQNFTQLLALGLVDTYRHLNPSKISSTLVNGTRRLDYALVSQEMLPAVQDSCIIEDVKGSDHYPIKLGLNLSKIN